MVSPLTYYFFYTSGSHYFAIIFVSILTFKPDILALLPRIFLGFNAKITAHSSGFHVLRIVQFAELRYLLIPKLCG
jgi:hypothetical protein